MTCYERGSMFAIEKGKKRLFLALELPEIFKDDLLRNPLPSQYGKMTSRGHLHLTLRFLGDMGPEEEQKVSEICRKIDFKPVPFSVDRYGFFPSFRKPASFHLRLKFFPELKELKVKVDKLLEESLGMEPEDPDRYIPHITLYRIRKVISPEECKSFLEWGLMQNIFSSAGNKMTLFQSYFSLEGGLIHAPIVSKIVPLQ